VKALAILVLLGAAAAAGAWYWLTQGQVDGGADPVVATTVDRRIPVRVAEATPRRFETTLESLGTAQANESVTLTASVTAHVAEIAFQDGDQVEAGQVLVRLASAEEFAEQREAQVTLTEQRRELNRIRGLAADGIVPQQQVDQQRSRVEEAEARLAGVEARISDRVIQAPFTGVLGLRRVSTASLVSPGTPVAELDDISVIKVDFTVSERFLGAIRPGMPIEARGVAFADRVYAGRVSAVATRLDVATRTITVRAEIDNADRELRPGMLLTTRIALDPAERLSIPEGALVTTADQHFVFVNDGDDKARRQPIRIGRREPGRVEVLEGLSAGERVVTEGVLRVRSGSEVRVLDEATT
jgi:membrane fusion protein (multidrug efflux system)